MINVLGVAFLVYWHIDQKQNIVDKSREGAEAAAQSAAKKIGEKVEQLEIAEKLSEEISDGTLADEDIPDRFNREMENNPEISSLSIAYLAEFTPERTSSETPRGELSFYDKGKYSPSPANPEKTGHLYFISRIDPSLPYCAPSGEFFACRFNTYYLDNTPPEVDVGSLWYTKPLQSVKGVWSNAPYFGNATGIFWAGGFGAPFFLRESNAGLLPGPEVAGIISADITVDQIRSSVFDAITKNLGEFPTEASYAFIFAEEGTLISHPNSDYLLRQATFEDDFCFTDQNCLDRARRIKKSVESEIPPLENYVEHLSGSESLVFFAKIGEGNWWLAIVVDKEAILSGPDDIGRFRLQEIGIAFSVLSSLFLFGLLIFLSFLPIRTESGGSPRLWAISGAFTLLTLAGISFLWFTNITSELDNDERDIVLTNEAIPSKVILSCAAAEQKSPIGRDQANKCNAGKLRSVPTGLFVQSVEFSSANNVIVTGYVWQKYSKELRDLVPNVADGVAGFILPEADNPTIELTFQEDLGDSKVFGWYFTATLRQEFDYSEYPFDNERVWIRLWPNEFAKGVVLSPDFDSYDTTRPIETPGLEKQDFVIEGWKIEESFFSYRLNSYDTNFGLARESRQNFPELYFNIGMRRDFIDAFIANMIPIAVVSVLLFAVLLMAGSPVDREDRFGFSTANVLAFNAALFFVVIVSHVGLRDSLSAQGVVYIESFYFILYGAILAVSANSILVAARLDNNLLLYRDNLIARLLYWPIMLGITLIVTWFSFS